MGIPAYRTYVLVLLLVLTCVAVAQAQQQVARARVTEGPTITYVDDQFAVVAWSTDAPAESRVFYGTNADDLIRVAESLKATTLHRVDLPGLKPDTTYYFQLDTGSGDAPVHEFRTVAANGAPLRGQQPVPAATAPPPEPAPPAPPGVTITRGPTIEFADDRSAVISWATSDAAPSVVYYGTRRSDLTMTAEAASGTAFHRVHLSGLEPATTYFFALDTGQGQPSGPVSNFQTAVADGQPIYNRQAVQAAGDAAPPADHPPGNPAPAADNAAPPTDHPPENQERPRPYGGKEVPAGIEYPSHPAGRTLHQIFALWR